MDEKQQYHSTKELDHILHQVPPDYYQKGILTNRLQRMWHMGKLHAVLDLIDSYKPKKILDVGCAGGWFLSEISKRFPSAKFTGVDVYKPAVLYAGKQYKSLTFITADAHKLPFPDDSFDLVICTEVLEHVINPEEVMMEITRILKKKGVAIIEMDSGNFLFRIIWHWWTNMRKGVWKDAHIHAFTARKLEELLKKSKLRVKKRKSFNFSMAVVFRLEKS